MKPAAVFRVCLAAAALALQPATAAAAEDETQLWLTGLAQFTLSDTSSATVMLSQRFRGDATGGDYHLARGSIDYDLTDTVSIGGGATWIEGRTNSEWRTHQQVVLSIASLSLRTQLEERFASGADRIQLRLRERVQGTIALDPKDTLILSGELLYLVQPAARTENARVDSLRASALVQRALTSSVDARLGYLMAYAPRRGTDRIVHAPQLYLIAHF